MPLCDKIWTPIPFSKVISEFLIAERWRFDAPDDLILIDASDLGDEKTNRQRLELLWRVRGGLLEKLPQAIGWYEVSNLTQDELSELHIIARCGWDAAHEEDRNELFLAAKRNPKILQTPPDRWASLILFGHRREGPFTIIEGNNRLAAYVSLEKPPALNGPVLIGLSPHPFHHHIFDPPQ